MGLCLYLAWTVFKRSYLANQGFWWLSLEERVCRVKFKVLGRRVVLTRPSSSVVSGCFMWQADSGVSDIFGLREANIVNGQGSRSVFVSEWSRSHHPAAGERRRRRSKLSSTNKSKTKSPLELNAFHRAALSIPAQIHHYYQNKRVWGARREQKTLFL